MIGKLKDLMRLPGGGWFVSFTTGADPRKLFDDFRDKEVSIEIGKVKKKRTKTANDFCWAMCTDIANALTTTKKDVVYKEDVYRETLRAMRDKIQAFDTLHMRAEAIPTFRTIWAGNGIGWFTEVVDYSPIPGCKVVLAYRGSSTFDSRQMSIVIDALKQDMENMELAIPVSKEEEARLMAAWDRAYCKQNANATSVEEKPASNDTTSSQG